MDLGLGGTGLPSVLTPAWAPSIGMWAIGQPLLLEPRLTVEQGCQSGSLSVAMCPAHVWLGQRLDLGGDGSGGTPVRPQSPPSTLAARLYQSWSKCLVSICPRLASQLGAGHSISQGEYFI